MEQATVDWYFLWWIKLEESVCGIVRERARDSKLSWRSLEEEKQNETKSQEKGHSSYHFLCIGFF